VVTHDLEGCALGLKHVLETPLDYKDDEDANPRDLEIRQIVNLMNVIAEEIFIDQFDDSLGTYRIENKIQRANFYRSLTSEPFVSQKKKSSTYGSGT